MSLIATPGRAELPKETARYRLQELMRKGVIQNFLAVIDGGRLGFYYFKIFFRFHNVSEQSVGRVIEHLKGKEKVTWIVRLDGQWDIGFTVNVTNPVELSALIDEIRVPFSKFIHRWIYSVNMENGTTS